MAAICALMNDALAAHRPKHLITEPHETSSSADQAQTASPQVGIAIRALSSHSAGPADVGPVSERCFGNIRA
ncbi:hypothetical protein N7462_010540 [Penicillium macrosclerotiorum]|uniref:uncharacterized protein n=1 Tax=Penicillium macrosclerotiorum TaxID=303699 RepID=UPI002547F8C3|nr:uncharacterized protein N7462_010540 [Penicillium macrosclerotiorum]KAJ5669470.1 hypothetical protein N7462_010540 [Penicillium macrosclerotiorum]